MLLCYAVERQDLCAAQLLRVYAARSVTRGAYLAAGSSLPRRVTASMQGTDRFTVSDHN
jgi:hypothetical protein